MTISDKNGARDGNHSTDTAVGSRTLPSRLEQALLTKVPVSAEQPIVVYECAAAQLGAVYASLCQAGIGTKTLNDLWNRCVDPIVGQLRALRDLAENVDTRLTDLQISPERQTDRPRTRPEDLRTDTGFRSPNNAIAPAALLMASGAASVAYNASESGLAPEVSVQPLPCPEHHLPHHGQQISSE